eukprot:scaffold3608_cov183-Amphora_coffeaeformis.AAC.11
MTTVSSTLFGDQRMQCEDDAGTIISSSIPSSCCPTTSRSLIEKMAAAPPLPIGFGFAVVLMAMLLLLVVSFLLLAAKRFQTWYRLQHGSGIPTIYWRPRFINYQSGNAVTASRQMSSSTITNILPRMKRLQGPYDMYGTVYGISTAVVHVAHPIPALALLLSSSSSSQPPTATTTTTTTEKRGQRARGRLHGSGACKAPAYNHFKNFCGDGVFTANGEDWKQKRAAVTHALLKTTGDSGNWETKLERQAGAAAEKLVRTLSAQTSSPCNVLPILQRTTVGLIFQYITHTDLDEKLYGHEPHDAVAAAAAGEDDHSTASTVSSQESEDEKTTTKSDNNNHEGSLLQLFQSYLDSIVQIRMIILAKSRSIWFLLPQWCYRIFSTMSVEEEFTLIPIRKFSTMACQSAQKGSPLAGLQSLELYQSTKEGFSKNLLDEAITLLFAGQDTSAATLSWTLHLLSLSPKVQVKLAREVQRVMKEEDVDEGVSVLGKRVLAKMTYLDAVIKESMRLYPVAPFVVRRLPFAVTVGDKGQQQVTIPGNTVACIWIYSLHRHPDFWLQPDEFLPERWLVTDNVDAGITNGAYMPFAAGPRNCVGQPLAHVILRTLLAQLVVNFEFQDPGLTNDDDTDKARALRKDMQAGFTVLPKDGVQLRVVKRQ